MARYYYVNKQSGYNNNHVVHANGCKYLPDLEGRLFLGTFYSATAAIQQARKYYPGSLGCEECCPVTAARPQPAQDSVALKHGVDF
ncbi:hypothetical protein [Pantoea sp. OXWO6B1]|uniref:hypothetical protein n=1 Tax=Pantoea sp. OXWO6B1 TaxID=1835724 RepID=UPI0007C6A032|nr:hypothetical protein [Pantoea sp. OXWO6B1]OAE08665.1 hypothetical protein A6A26_14085 [Pantoea sp. OXWO6B1]